MSKEGLSENFFFQTLKAAVIATAFCVAFAAITAAVSGFVFLSAAAVKIVGAAAKVVSLALGALLSFRGGKCWLKGLAAGVLFAMLTAFLFSAISRSALSVRIFIDLALGAAEGLLSGVLVSVVRPV